MGTDTLFSTEIYKTRIVPAADEFENLDFLLKNIFEKVDANQWAMETGRSTGSEMLTLHFFREMDWLTSAMYPYVKQYWEHLGYRKGADLGILAAWANSHLENDYTGVHTHCGGAEQSHISAVFYFKKPKKSGNIEFIDPLEYIKQMTPIHHYSEHDVFKEVQAEQFDLILFPSWLKHRTQKNLSNEERIAISINFVGYWNFN